MSKNKYSGAGLRELFQNNFNCYADTKDESVVLAMDEDKFVEVVKKHLIGREATLVRKSIWRPGGARGAHPLEAYNAVLIVAWIAELEGRRNEFVLLDRPMIEKPAFWKRVHLWLPIGNTIPAELKQWP